MKNSTYGTQICGQQTNQMQNYLNIWVTLQSYTNFMVLHFFMRGGTGIWMEPLWTRTLVLL